MDDNGLQPPVIPPTPVVPEPPKEEPVIQKPKNQAVRKAKRFVPKLAIGTLLVALLVGGLVLGKNLVGVKTNVEKLATIPRPTPPPEESPQPSPSSAIPSPSPSAPASPVCTIYPFVAGSIKQGSNNTTTVTCDYGKAINCLSVSITINNTPTTCPYIGSSGTIESFSCNVSFDTVTQATCSTWPGSSDNCCSSTNIVKKESSSPSPSLLPNPSVSPTPGVSPSPNVCFDTCGSDSDCPSSLRCMTVSGDKRCVNPNCTNETDCTCATSKAECWDKCQNDNDCVSSCRCMNIPGTNDKRCANPSCVSQSDCNCNVAYASASPAQTKGGQPTLPQAGVSGPAVLGVSAGLLMLLGGLLF